MKNPYSFEITIKAPFEESVICKILKQGESLGCIYFDSMFKGYLTAADAAKYLLTYDEVDDGFQLLNMKVHDAFIDVYLVKNQDNFVFCAHTTADCWKKQESLGSGHEDDVARYAYLLLKMCDSLPMQRFRVSQIFDSEDLLTGGVAQALAFAYFGERVSSDGRKDSDLRRMLTSGWLNKFAYFSSPEAEEVLELNQAVDHVVQQSRMNTSATIYARVDKELIQIIFEEIKDIGLAVSVKLANGDFVRHSPGEVLFNEVSFFTRALLMITERFVLLQILV